MLCNHLKNLLNFFDGLGYNSGSSDLSSSKTLVIFCNFLQICLSVAFESFQVHIVLLYLHQRRMIVLLNQQLQYSVAFSTFVFIIFDSIYQRKNHHKFWKIVQWIDQHFACQNNFNCFWFIFNFFSFFFISTFCILTIYVIHDCAIEIDIFVYFFINKICQFRIFYFILCVDVLFYQLKVLKNMLASITGNFYGESQTHRLKWARLYFKCIYDMATHLNEVFGLSNVAVFLFCFVFFLTDLNWVHTYLYRIPLQQYPSMSSVFRLGSN